MDHKEFDDILGNKLGETQNFPFDENQWAEMETRLDEQKKKRRPILWLFWGSAAFVLLVLGFGYYSYTLNQKINDLEHKVEQFSQRKANPNLEIASTKNELNVEEPAMLENNALDNDEIVESASTILTHSKIDEKEINGAIKKSPKNSPLDRTIVVNNIPKSDVKSKIDLDEQEQNSATDVIVLEEEKIAEQSQTEIIFDELIEQESVDQWKEFDLLNDKEDVLAFSDLPEFGLEEQRFKNAFRFKGISFGIFANHGWRIASSNAYTLSFRDANSDDQSFGGFNPSSAIGEEAGIERSLVWQFGVQTSFRFTHGFRVNIGLSQKKYQLAFDDISYRSLNIPSFYASNFDAGVIGDLDVIQKQWVLGTGIDYSPFSKWNVRPFVGIVPEFSWLVNRNEDYLFLDADELISPIILDDPGNYTSVETSNDNSFTLAAFNRRESSFKLRNITTRIGLEGEFKSKFQWQVSAGLNTALKNQNPSLLNRFQVGMGLNYILN